MTDQEMIKTIETAIAEVEWEYHMDYAVAFDKAVSILKHYVKCENCKHCDIDSDTGYAYCTAWQRGTQVDWHCSRGELK